MALILGTILALLSVAVAVFPFVQRRRFGLAEEAGAPREARETREMPGQGDQGGLPETEADTPGLESIYDAIQTLQLERELGNIPEGLYREQLNGYRLQAAVALREQTRSQVLASGPTIDAGQPFSADWALEEEIRVARAGLRREIGDAVRCPNCAAPVPAGAELCPECGVELTVPPQPRPSEQSGDRQGIKP
jgi:hypothetical protein